MFAANVNQLNFNSIFLCQILNKDALDHGVKIKIGLTLLDILTQLMETFQC